MFNRIIKHKIIEKLGKGKAIILVGPRQVGKTTLINHLIEDKPHLFLDADDPTIKTLLTLPNTAQIRNILGDNKLVFIDEAQRIEGIGITLKIIIDQFKDVQLLVTGSSSFDLGNAVNESLTGRKWQYELYPISWEEYENKIGFVKAEQQIENRILYGFYPDVLNNEGNEIEILKQLVDSYLYKDILSLSDIRKPEILEKLVRALAFQVGSEVSYNELAQTIGIDKNTVSKYIDLLEQAYVVFRLGSFSKNLRNEIKRNQKIYFYDTGVRNLVIGNFSYMNARLDKGALWENFLIAERIKQNSYHHPLAKVYFWRTKQQQEVDLVETSADEITGFEFKWKVRKNVKLSKTFTETYKAKSVIIDKNNFRTFVLPNKS